MSPGNHNRKISEMDYWNTYHWIVQKALPNIVYVFDPYVIHRRPPKAFGTQRTFVRVTFVPIEIYDDACTSNPLLPSKVYNRTASCTRDSLKEYKGKQNA